MPRCRPEAGPQEKASVGVRRVAIDTGKVLRTAVAARPRVGSQARSKARDSRSLPEGVPRFESWPTHHQLAPTCARVHPTRQRVSRSGNCVLLRPDSGQPAFGFGRRAANSTTAPTSPKPIPNATRGTTGSGWQPPGSEHFRTRLNPRNTSNRPIPRMVRPDGIAKRLERGINMLAIPQLVKTKYTLLGPHPIG